MTPTAAKIIKAIINDLNDRSGLGLDGLDAATKREIKAEWGKLIDDILNPATPGYYEASDGTLRPIAK